jgi:3',5'-nucleoside bisphosphate phosphatase
MNIYRADIHIHSVLSPCGGLDMSPAAIVAKAKELQLDMIGITDHNTTLHCNLIRKLAADQGIFVLTGAEVTTREEVHCLAFFEETSSLNEFQDYLVFHLPFIKNNPSIFGYQVVVDEQENILEEIEPLLIVGINQSVEQVRAKVKELSGIFIPAHVDRQRYGILGQLGFMPEALQPDAVELYGKTSREAFLSQYPEFEKYRLVKNSDAHCPEQIGRYYSVFRLEELSFSEIQMALHGKKGREVLIA